MNTQFESAGTEKQGGITPLPGIAGIPEEQVLRAVHGLKFGSVEIVIHQGRIVQIERREKLRFEETRH